MLFALPVGALTILGGCVAFGGIEQIGPDEYRIGVKSATTDEDAALAERAALQAAEEFCLEQGLRMTQSVGDNLEVTVRSENGAIARGNSTLAFRCR
jgi:hypothetical protein